jgi:glycerate kinase
MKILICPDKFKESLSAAQVSDHIRSGILNVFPDAECKMIPMADGGEGTVDALVNATGGAKLRVMVNDPLMRPVESFFGISGDRSTAFIEMAAASGMALLKPTERNPMHTTTFGTGELIRQAIDKGYKKIIIGIGGSATIVGGVGMAQALGVRFLDEKGKKTGHGGRYLKIIKGIDASEMDSRIKECRIYAACDVRNLLSGKSGAAYIYGKQKGAGPSDIKELDKGLRNLSEIIKTELNTDVAELSGGGAAGGLGAGIVAFLHGELKHGFDLIAEIAGLNQWIEWADLVVTGEGKIDSQTVYGKVPAGIAKLALRKKKPAIGFAGIISHDIENLYDMGFSAIIPIADRPMTLDQSIKNAGRLLEDAVTRTFRLLSINMH